MNSNGRAHAVYWVLGLLLFAAQAAVTRAGLEGLRYEELADFIRNPFWFDHRLIYDGASTNVAWYGLLVLTYKIVGFSPYASKYLRLVLHVPFLVCSALLLKQWVGQRRGWLPFAAVGLSPTALYFNSFAYGIDLQLFPVMVWLIVRSTGSRVLLHVAIGGLAMLTCLSYPSFVLYVPLLLAFYIWIHRGAGTGRLTTRLALAAAGFAAPFVAALVYLRNSARFLSDPSVGGAGVFRGGGNAITLDPTEISRAIATVFQDLLIRGGSYYFALPHVEFSGLVGAAAAWGIVVAALVAAWTWKPARVPLVLAAALCVVAIVAPAISQHLPGLRRSTGFISGAYVIVACVWAAPVPAGLRAAAVWTGKIACLLLVAHHLIVFGPNRQFRLDEALHVDDSWFYRFGPPDRSIRTWARDWVLQGKPLACDAPVPCRYSEIYAATAGYLEWNGFGERRVSMIDPRTGRVIELDIRSLDSGRFPP